MSVDVCYLISHGFSARMVLHSDLVPEMRGRGLSVTCITPDAHEPSMRAECKRLDINAVAPPIAPRLLERVVFQKMQRYVFEDIGGNPALRARYLREVNAPPPYPGAQVLARALLGLNKAALGWPVLPGAVDAVQKKMLHRPELTSLLEELSPRLLVATYPVNFLESAFLESAARLGIPTALHLLSWDNITCKGRFPILADHYISWGSVMTSELMEYYGVASERISECGVPHFDLHAERLDVDALRHELANLGLDSTRPYLFFGMSSPVFAPREIDVVEWLARAVADGVFGDDMQLVVRPHPQNVQGGMADQSWLPRLEALGREPRVGLDLPKLRPSQLAWNMERSDLSHLSTLISGCVACLNSGSTLSIDALRCGRPVILTSFDGDSTLPWWQSARRLKEYIHLAKLIRCGGVQVVGGYEALEAVISDYVEDPDRDADSRARTSNEFCGPSDGGACARVAEAVGRLASEGGGHA